MTRFDRRITVLVCAGVAAAALATGPATADTCTPRVLVLSAFPGEIDKLLNDDATSIDATKQIDGRTFFVGSVQGNDAVLALTGIGLLNAEATTKAAIAGFRCGEATAISRVVFSGVGGGRYIGDVAVPDRWTRDGETWIPVDVQMLEVAREISGSVALADEVPAGDVACVGADPRLAHTVTVTHEPAVVVGGDGKSADPFGGRMFPCTPGGGDVFGCRPCSAPGVDAAELERFATGIVPFIDPAFFFGYFQSPPPATTTYAAEDMETVAAAEVAAANNLPFIAFRAVSDGDGDPLGLPGFPFQFFYYRQLAADNAAAATLAFLKEWASG